MRNRREKKKRRKMKRASEACGIASNVQYTQNGGPRRTGERKEQEAEKQKNNG